MSDKEQLKQMRFDIARLKTDMELIRRIKKLSVVDEIKRELMGVTQIYGEHIRGNKTIREAGYSVAEVKRVLERVCDTVEKGSQP